VPYAIERYTTETRRLYGVLNDRLKDHHYWPTNTRSPTSRLTVGGAL